MPLQTRISGKLRRFIEAQPLFFVATAAREGRVNLSPKGADTLRVLGPNHVRWLNLTGSGNETAGHIRACNRITLMFCAFEGDAMILRLYGTATTLHAHDTGWDSAISEFPKLAGSRQIMDVTVDSARTSCGMGVPIMPFRENRAEKELVPYFERLGEARVKTYWNKMNSKTIDGLPTGTSK